MSVTRVSWFTEFLPKAIMSDEGERTCPLCAEEMDLTDQQLKPCKCGYEICVWCWHHILEMAEKDDTEGRCPACRSPYDKEKIVGMAANCERLVAEVHMEKKMKNQKAKSKSSEARKQLSSVRVIQRNLVYIVGLPLNLADEDLLQQREYFGQYGKVLKVSMSRTTAGVVQQFPNNTCSVYITYSKEEEAIRCIQNVHGFVLEGRPLRACFGTTKYCHAWLRNMPCSNPDCLYLHGIGSHEDSFTKDEIVSAYTRSRVQQITGAAYNMQRQSGNVLPPPLDDCTDNSSGKSIVKNSSSTSVSIVRGSPPNGTSGRPIALSAAAACTSSYWFLHDARNEQRIGRLVSDAVNIGSDAAMDKGESSIISNILSMESDAWDDSLTSHESLAKLLGDNTDNQNGPLKKSSSWKVQSNNQSRFSFARQEESKFQANVHPSSGANQQFPKNGSLIQDFVERDFSLDKLGFANGIPSNNLEESGNLGSGHFIASNNKLSAVSRAQISAPPGFSVPNRAPPPGFSSLERMGQAFDSLSVVKGRIQGAQNSPVLDMRSNYPEQLNYFENEARVQLLMQRSLSPHQNLRFSEIGNSFSQFGDSYGISSRLNQSQVSNLASFPQLSLQQSRNAILSNGQLDGWNEVPSGNGLGVAELLRNERLGFNKFYRGYDDSKYRMPNSMDLFNRTFGI